MGKQLSNNLNCVNCLLMVDYRQFGKQMGCNICTFLNIIGGKWLNLFLLYTINYKYNNFRILISISVGDPLLPNIISRFLVENCGILRESLIASINHEYNKPIKSNLIIINPL